jgi:hypothetical protein
MGPDDVKRLFTSLQRMDSHFTSFKGAVGADVDTILLKLQEIKAEIGTKPQDRSFLPTSDEYSTTWETFLLFKA